DVVAEKARAGVRYGHGNDALSRTAAYLANFRSLQELFVELGDRRNPLARDPGLIACLEESLDAFDDVVAEVCKGHTATVLKGLRQLGYLCIATNCVLKASGREEHAMLVGQHQRLLWIHAKGFIDRLVFQVSSRGHRRRPLAHVTLV